MIALPVTLAPMADADVRGIPADLRPAALEHLTRIGLNYFTCSRPTTFPRPAGHESGLWLRRGTGSAELLEVLFVVTADPEGIRVRRVLVTRVDRLPDWVNRPTEWSAYPHWQIRDL